MHVRSAPVVRGFLRKFHGSWNDSLRAFPRIFIVPWDVKGEKNDIRFAQEADIFT